MNLNALITLAFEQGCGTSRRAAGRSPRMHELTTQPYQLTFAAPQTVGVIAYLGERLAARAFDNLPKAARESAGQWTTLTQRQQEALAEQLVQALNSDAWTQANSKRTYDDSTSNPHRVLPRQYGSWTRGRVPPNCLGVAQMLIGFGQQSGAEHMLVNVIESRDSAHYQRMFVMVSNTLRALQDYTQFSDIKQEYRRLRNTVLPDVLAAIETNTVQSQAHHALAIRGETHWLVIDPYMKTWYREPLGESLGATVAGLARSPDRNGLSINTSQLLPNRHHGVLRAIEMAMHFLERCINRKAEAEELIDVLHLASIALTCSKKHWDQLEKLMGEEGVTLSVHFERRLVRVYDHLRANALLPTHRRKQWPEMDADEQERLLEQYIARSGSDPRFRATTAARLLLTVIESGYDWLNEVKQSRDGRAHPVIELLHPTYGLGIATINHLAHCQGVDTPELVALSSSQWILRDTLAAVERSSDTTYRAIRDERLANLTQVTRGAVLYGLRRYHPGG